MAWENERAESLFLTVSADHRRRELPEYTARMSEPFLACGGYLAAYEGVILGGAERLFGVAELELWLRRHRYAAYDMRVLLPIAHLCLEEAVRVRLAAERSGIPVMAERAATELLGGDPLNWRASSRDWLRIDRLCKRFPAAANAESRAVTARLSDFTDMALFESLVSSSADCGDAKSLVAQAVLLYQKIFTRYFAPDHDLDPLPERELPEGGAEPTEPDEPREAVELTFDSRHAEDDFTLTAEQLADVPEYLARNFGPSFKTAHEMEEIERAVCTDLHEDRKLLFTDGFPESVYAEASERARSAASCRAENRAMLRDHEAAVRAGIRSIEQAFRNVLRSDPETYRAHFGELVNGELWKAERCDDPQLFRRTVAFQPPSVALELLIDASGSQRSRQSMVAMQSYLFSAAISRLHIPHRVMSYCTYGDYTVLRRFRDYDDGADADLRILDYRATSNNRDGLAVAAAGQDLLRRREEHKLVLVFSDGLPNDMVSGRVREGMPKKYVGDTAVRDTCAQVRKLIRRDVTVLGVFLGEDRELENERLIYGSSFVHIRAAEDFAGSAGKRLREVLMQAY